MDNNKNLFVVKKSQLYIALLILAAFIGGMLLYPALAPVDKNGQKNGVPLIEPVSAEEVYPLFVCSCCGQPLDKNNICCEIAKSMIEYIDSLVSKSISKDDVIMTAANKFGINSVVESKRAEISAKLAELNPGSFPTEKLQFSEALGKKAPDFSLENLDGKTVKLSDYKGKNVVLFFNEGSMCYPACWDQIEKLGADERFKSDDVAAFSIVSDTKEQWQDIVKQAPQYGKGNLLFDSGGAVSSAYDVLFLNSSMHKGSFPGHTFFIIDKEGVVRFTLDDPAMAIRNDMMVSEIAKLTNN